MKLSVHWCVPLFAALISCSMAQLNMEDGPEHSYSGVGADENEQLEQRCVPTKECGVDEVFKCCGPCYQLTCFGTALNCDGRCFAECYCVSGFVREFPGGRCIPQHICQKLPPPILADYEDDSNEE
uniref:TIL domain-containing protein n=1 Tax=Anopheles epiroticus TaxID=199890 RepID=A0A182P751_9DIPT